MQKHDPKPKAMIYSFWKNKFLILSLVKREILARYRGSIIGILWSFMNPLLMLTVYTFIFSVVFKARWGSDGNSRTEFALVLFIGLIVFNLFSECINRSPTIILNNANLVKKVVFPLEVLPIIILMSAFFHFLINFGVWLIAYLLLVGLPSPLILNLPFVLIPLLLFTLGCSYFLSSLSVYIRDFHQIVGVFTLVLMYLSPVFYSTSSIPDDFRYYLMFNPLTPIIEMVREITYFRHPVNPFEILVLIFFSSLVAFFGFSFFQKARGGFAEVI